MKLHRFFISPKNIQGQEINISDKELIKRLIKVLRLKIGEKTIFLDNSGKEYKTVIRKLRNEICEGEIIEIRENQNEPRLKITLYQALCKKDKFELVLQKGTEVGISEFVPIITERTEKLKLDFERAKKILKEAAEQSERGIIPKLAEAKNFDGATLSSSSLRLSGSNDLSKDNQAILLDRSGDSIKNYKLQITNYKLHIFVGPEGGFTEQEIELAEKSGAKIISLGPRILRTETAGLVAAGIALLTS